jgi:hypothetical protein
VRLRCWVGLREKDAAIKLMESVEQVCRAGVLTLDLGESSDTKGVARAICEDLRARATHEEKFLYNDSLFFPRYLINLI